MKLGGCFRWNEMSLPQQAACCLIVLISFAGCEPAKRKPFKADDTKSQTSKPDDETSKGQAYQASIAVAAAADLRFALDEIVTEFERQHPGLKVEVTYGASGNLFAQLSNRAPFDMFLSADIGYPRKLIEQGDAVRESEFQYAVGHIGVWVLQDSKLDIAQQGIKALTDPSVKKISIANPKHAPYGRAAEAALKHFEIYDVIQDRLVLGENVAQATQFVDSGAADAGIIAQSLAMAPPLRDKGRFQIVPTDAYPRLEQGGVRLEWAKSPEACQQLQAFIVSDKGREILKSYGFDEK